MGRQLIEMTGKVFSEWTVMKYAGRDNTRQALWLCKCKCGDEKVVGGSRLRNGASKSCGHGKKEHMSKINKGKRLPEGEASFRDLFRCYKYDAQKRKRKNVPFELTEQQFRSLTKQFCYYCGVKPQQIWHPKGTHGAYIFNGVDRLDNTKGYTTENTEACCNRCNMMKGELDKEDYIATCIEVASNRQN